VPFKQSICAVQCHNPRPHFWAEHDKNFSVYMSELQGALPFIQQQPGSAVLGDASESSFAFYMAAGAIEKP
jgi:hypothetical protein